MAADLALIAAAQKVEHYEISAYGSVRAMAQQLHQAEVVLLLSKTLAEEENADNLLSQLARPMMSQVKGARMKQGITKQDVAMQGGAKERKPSRPRKIRRIVTRSKR